jgi:hypothetical protein
MHILVKKKKIFLKAVLLNLGTVLSPKGYLSMSGEVFCLFVFYLFIYLFLRYLGFELRASHLLGKHSIT